MRIILFASLLFASFGFAQEIRTDGTTGPRGKQIDYGGQTHYTNHVTSAEIAEVEKKIKNVPVVVLPRANERPERSWSFWFRNMTQ